MAGEKEHAEDTSTEGAPTHDPAVEGDQPAAANYADVSRALSDQTQGILDRIPLERVQLSQPLDGAGARICASVEVGQADQVPESVDVTIGKRQVRIPLEALEDYESMIAFEPSESDLPSSDEHQSGGKPSHGS